MLRWIEADPVSDDGLILIENLVAPQEGTVARAPKATKKQQQRVVMAATVSFGLTLRL